MTTRKPRNCGAPGCTGIHAKSRQHPYSAICPAAKEKHKSTKRACHAKRAKSDPQYVERERARSRARAAAARPKVAEEDRCVFPGCRQPRRDELDLCAQYHGGAWGQNSDTPDETLNENDGLVDWVAVEIAAGGQRRVRLTWVERDLAAAIILGAGFSATDVELRTGYPIERTGQRYRRLQTLGARHYANWPSGTAAA